MRLVQDLMAWTVTSEMGSVPLYLGNSTAKELSSSRPVGLCSFSNLSIFQWSTSSVSQGFSFSCCTRVGKSRPCCRLLKQSWTAKPKEAVCTFCLGLRSGRSSVSVSSARALFGIGLCLLSVNTSYVHSCWLQNFYDRCTVQPEVIAGCCALCDGVCRSRQSQADM